MKQTFFLLIILLVNLNLNAQSLGDINKDLNDAKSRTDGLLQQIKIISSGSNSSKEAAAINASLKASRITKILKRAHRNAGIEWKKISNKIKLKPGSGLQGYLYYAYQASETIEYNTDKFNNVSSQNLKEKYFKKTISSFNELREAIDNSKSRLYEIVGKLAALELKEKRRKENIEIVKKNQELEIIDSPERNYIYIRNVKYKTTKINETVWMAENLTVSHFANGDPIPYARTKEEWTKAANEKKPAYCYLNNNEANKHLGKFYNGFVIIDSRGVAPKNWRIPTRNDWKRLAAYMNKTHGSNTYSDKLKSTKGWSKYNKKNNGTNETGFSAIPTGANDSNEELSGSNLASFSQWWSSTKDLSSYLRKNYLFSPSLEYVKDGFEHIYSETL